MQNLKLIYGKIFPLVKNITIPSVLFTIGLVWFYGTGNLPFATAQTLHVGIYALYFTAFMTLLYFNRSKPVFFLLVMAVAYACTNYLKLGYGENFASSPAYVNLSVMIPFNLGILFFLPGRRLLCKTNVYILLILFTELSVCEMLSRQGIGLNLNINFHIGNIGALGILMYLTVLTAAFYKISRDGFLLEYALFFAILSTFLGFVYAENAGALSIFYSFSTLSVTIALAGEIHFQMYKNTLSGLSGRYAFAADSQNFPLKYSLALISIDGYDRWQTMFGKRDRDNLVKMIISRIMESEDESSVYHYDEDELIIIYKNEGKKEIAEKTEAIRRSIASAEFMLSGRQKAVKLTVSTCISEKKRSDANSIEVLYRMKKALQKANEFSHNVSTAA